MHATSPNMADMADMADMETHASQASSLLQALSNPHRLMLLCTLSAGERSVGDLNASVPLSQSALSQHLAVLRRQQLVTARRASQTIYYSVRPGPALEIVSLLHTHFCASSDAGSHHKGNGAEAPPTAMAPPTVQAPPRTQLKPKGE